MNQISMLMQLPGIILFHDEVLLVAHCLLQTAFLINCHSIENLKPEEASLEFMFFSLLATLICANQLVENKNYAGIFIFLNGMMVYLLQDWNKVLACLSIAVNTSLCYWVKMPIRECFETSLLSLTVLLYFFLKNQRKTQQIGNQKS